MKTRRSRGVLPLSIAAVAAVTMAGIVGCRSDILKEPAGPLSESGLSARVQVLEGSDCRGQASVVTAPGHCVWPASANRSRMMSAVVQFVAHVGPDGRPDGARVLAVPPDNDFEEATLACALSTTYRPQVDEQGAPIAGETCPVSFKLARYAPDVARSEPPPFPCPPVRTPGASFQTSGVTGASGSDCPFP